MYNRQVLSQDDSAVGVKNGVNGFGTKNYFGTFAPPTAVINDFTFLATLDDRDWLGGLSEAVKVAIIKDAAFFADIEQAAPRLVARAAALKLPLRALATMYRRWRRSNGVSSRPFAHDNRFNGANLLSLSAWPRFDAHI